MNSGSGQVKVYSVNAHTMWKITVPPVTTIPEYSTATNATNALVSDLTRSSQGLMSKQNHWR